MVSRRLILTKVCKYKVVSSCFNDDYFSRLCLQDHVSGIEIIILRRDCVLCKLADILAFTIINIYCIMAYIHIYCIQYIHILHYYIL
jgi:hypothetical protein